MTLLEGLLQGILQGLTEFLPVSSSGHLSLFQHLFGLSGEHAVFFDVLLHVGTLLAVFIAYWKTIWRMIVEFFLMLADLFRGKFKYKECNEERKMVLMVLLTLVPLLVFYFIKDSITALSEDADILVEGACFLFTGAMLFMADKCVKGRKTAVDMTPREALRIGLFQGIASLPGVSRSGSTVSIGLLSGFSREFMVKFSFIMGIPAIMGASLSEIGDAMQEGLSVTTPMLAGMAAALVVGIGAIKLLTWLVKTDRFGIFAYYTLFLGVIVLIIGIIEHIAGDNIISLAATLFNQGVK